MLENYFQRIESIITPTNYSKENISAKIMNESSNDIITVAESRRIGKEMGSHCGNSINDLVYCNEPMVMTSSEGFPLEKQERIKKMKRETEGKLEHPEKQFNSGFKDSTSYDNDSSKSNSKGKHLQRKPKSLNQIDTNNLSDSEMKALMEKVQVLSYKNMSTRYENEQLRKKIEEKTKENRELKLAIEKSEQEKEQSCKYLLKLESMIQRSNNTTRKNSRYVMSNELPQKTQNKIAFDPTINRTQKSSLSQFEACSNKRQQSTNSNQYLDDYSRNRIEIKNGILVLIEEDSICSREILSLTSVKETKCFLDRLLKENIKLKQFQQEVYLISKSYDDINENLQDAIQTITKQLSYNSDSNSIGIDNGESLIHYDTIMKKVDEMLQVKQNEYNMLLGKKDEQIKLLKEELYIITQEVEYRKMDRVKEQRTFKDQEDQIISFQKQLSSFSDNMNQLTSNNFDNSHQYTSCNMLSSCKFGKKIESVKKTVNVLIKKIEKEFNLTDKQTATFLAKISKKIK